MLSLTRKADYALVALVDLGQRTGPASARQVAEAFGLPLPLLMNTLKELARAGIVRSTRGATGGYELAMDPAKISLLDVVTALEGSPPEASAEVPPAASAAEMDEVEEVAVLSRLHGRIAGFLQELSLADLLEEAEGGGDTETMVLLRTARDEPSAARGRTDGESKTS